MPTYEYVCDACGHTFDEFQSITAGPLRKCPECGKAKLRRLIGTGSGVIFKGSGFYQTDYRSEGYKKSADADKPAPPAESKTDKPPESKPAPEAKPAAKDKPKSSKPSKKD